MQGVVNRLHLLTTPFLPILTSYTYLNNWQEGGILQTMTLVLQELIVGISTGAIYALIALGYTMVYGIIELINFAHGDIFMIGTLVAIVILNALGVDATSHPTGFTLIGLMVVACVGAMLACAV